MRRLSEELYIYHIYYICFSSPESFYCTIYNMNEPGTNHRQLPYLLTHILVTFHKTSTRYIPKNHFIYWSILHKGSKNVGYAARYTSCMEVQEVISIILGLIRSFTFSYLRFSLLFCCWGFLEVFRFTSLLLNK